MPSFAPPGLRQRGWPTAPRTRVRGYRLAPPPAAEASGPDLLPSEPRYPNGYVIAFLDGHTECVPREEVGDLVWEPPSP